jgi:hypothetical protein
MLAAPPDRHPAMATNAIMPAFVVVATVGRARSPAR